MKILLTSAVIIALLLAPANGSFLNDFLTGAKNLWPKRQDLGSAQNRRLVDVRFELPVETEEFLKEGLDLINAPKEALDLCTHRVILLLKKDCNKLSQNDIGKLAVMLMNCQLELEGRSSFPCKPEMTLAQCTLPFDPQLQTIHALTTNRALAVCTALKQEQFKMATESAVNRLMQLALTQSEAVQEALQSQRRVNEISLQNIHEFKENHEKIMDSQTQSMEHISSAKDQLGEINSDLHRIIEMNQNAEQQTISIEKLASDIRAKLETSAIAIQKQNDEAREFMERFKHILQVISAITYTLELTLSKIEELFNEIGLNLTQELLIALLINIFYFTCGMVFVMFMEMQERCKHILIGLFVFNTLASYFNSDVPLLPLNVFVWTVFAAFRLWGKFKSSFIEFVLKIPSILSISPKLNFRERSVSRARSKTPLVEKDTNEKNKPPSKKLKKSKEDSDEDDEELVNLCAKEIKKVEEAIAKEQQVIQAVRPETPQNRPLTPAMLRVMTTDSGQLVNNRSGTPFNAGLPGRIQCQAYTVKGVQCRNAAMIDYTKCSVHNYQ